MSDIEEGLVWKSNKSSSLNHNESFLVALFREYEHAIYEFLLKNRRVIV